MQQHQQYQLGAWTVCPRSNTISSATDSHLVDNKSMQVLLLLIAQQGQAVSKEQILQQVWHGKVVTDDILSVTVSKIRKALGDNARSPTFIKTLSGKGYMLITDAQALTARNRVSDITTIDGTVPDGEESRAFDFSAIGSKPLITAASLLLVVSLALSFYFLIPGSQSGQQPLNITSIAVLPFDDLSSAQDNRHFTDGLSDAIIHQLSQINALKVISRYSSFAYRGNYQAPQIGAALGVDTLLDGSVQKAGDRVRINIRIFRTADGEQLWSQTFDSEIGETFGLQDTISASIKSVIQPGYQSNGEPVKSINAQAYEWYLMGQYLWRQRNPESLEEAVTFFQKSLELEPDYVDAHIGLGITYDYLHTYGNWDPQQSIKLALPHINKALQLNPSSSRGLAAKGLVLTQKAIYHTYRGQNDPVLYQEAQQAFLQSLVLDDNAMTHQWYSSLLRYMGNESLIVKHLNKAIELNPLSGALKRSYSVELLIMGKFDSAQRMFQQALELEPDYLALPVESSRINRYSEGSIQDMWKLHKQNPDVFTQCTSVEYCEHLVFTYLSIGATGLADEIRVNMGPTHFHFRTTLRAIAASARGDEQQALQHIETFAQWIKWQRRWQWDYAVAQFRAGQWEAAKLTLLQLYPKWQNANEVALTDIHPDNYKALLLYAAILASAENQAANPATLSQGLLRKLLAFLEQGSVFDKTEAEFTRAEVNAQLGNGQQALRHLATALQMGWMETFNKEWWTLDNNHFLQPLKHEAKFQQLLQQHQDKRNALRELVNSEWDPNG